MKIWGTAEVTGYIASLGDNKTWTQLWDRDEPDYNFIKRLEDQVINLTRTVRSDKGGGTTGHAHLVWASKMVALMANKIGVLNWLIDKQTSTLNKVVD